MNQQLPPVAPAVTAELVEALSPRLRKRLDSAVAKLAARPAAVDGDTVRIAVDAQPHHQNPPPPRPRAPAEDDPRGG
ncbi:hypothetical protein ABZ461_39605, partial [Actinacidiphila glaucinigra]